MKNRGITPSMVELLEGHERDKRRSAMIKEGPKPGPGFEFFDQTSKLLSVKTTMGADNSHQVRQRMVEAIDAGELTVIDMFTGLKIPRGGKIELDACWVSMRDIEQWAGRPISTAGDAATDGPSEPRSKIIPARLTYWANRLYEHMERIDATHSGKASPKHAIKYLKDLRDPRMTNPSRETDTPDRLWWRTEEGRAKPVKLSTVANQLSLARKWLLK